MRSRYQHGGPQKMKGTATRLLLAITPAKFDKPGAKAKSGN